MNVTINYKNKPAHYEVQRDSPGIYSAVLIHYEGGRSQYPPAAVTLTRGIRQWTGSDENENLVNEIGNKIEDQLRKKSRQN